MKFLYDVWPSKSTEYSVQVHAPCKGSRYIPKQNHFDELQQAHRFLQLRNDVDAATVNKRRRPQIMVSVWR